MNNEVAVHLKVYNSFHPKMLCALKGFWLWNFDMSLFWISLKRNAHKHSLYFIWHKKRLCTYCVQNMYHTYKRCTNVNIHVYPGYSIRHCNCTYHLYLLNWILYKKASVWKRYCIQKTPQKSWQCIKELYGSDCT